MCELCNHFPCLPGCPNGPEEPEVCCDCGDLIAGRFASLDGDIYCESCLRTMPLERLLMLCGSELEAV